MSITNFPDGITSFGVQVPSGGLPVTSGKYIFVDYTLGSDGNSGANMNQPVKTVAQAYSLARTNKDDVIVLMGNATHTLTAMLTVAKNRVHFVGLDACGGRRLGQNAKISLGVTTAATDIATVQNTGVRNSFHNIKFMNSNTVAEGLYSFADGGEYTYMEGCEIYKSTDLDETAAAELLCNADSAHYNNCTIGSTANIVADDKIRPCVLLSATLSGKKARDVQFTNCLFLRKAGGTEAQFIYGANATDVERMLLVQNSIFLNNALGAATPAHAVGFGAAQTQGSVILKDCTSVDCTVMAEAAVGIYVDGAVPGFATSGVSVTA